MHLTTRAIVLAQTEYGSQDKMLTLLTSDRGQLQAIVKNPRRKGTKSAAALEVLAYSEFVLYQGRTQYMIDSAELIENFFSIREDLTKISLAAYLSELTRYILPQADISGEVLSLLLNTLYLLQHGKRSPALLKGIYELRLMCLAGFMPDTECCHGCGKETGDFTLLPYSGVIFCPDCLRHVEPGMELDDNPADRIRIPFPYSTYLAFRHIVESADHKELFSFRLSSDTEKAFSAAAEAFTLAQTAPSFGSLDFYRTVAE